MNRLNQSNEDYDDPDKSWEGHVFGFDELTWFNSQKKADIRSFVDVNAWIEKPPEEQRFLILACQLYHGLIMHRTMGLNFLCRDIVITSLAAHYGKDSHYLISIQGSPPKGTFIVFAEGKVLNHDTKVFYSDNSDFKEIPSDLYREAGYSGPQHGIVIAFLKQWMAKREGTI